MYVGEPAIPICFVSGKSNKVTPLYPNRSDWIVPDALEEAPDIISPAEKEPFTFDTTTTVCAKVGAELNEVTFTGVVPSDSYKSKVFVAEFLTVYTPGV